MKAFVTGGNGFLGQGMTAALLEVGWEVRCQTRGNEKKLFREGDGVERFVVTDPACGRFAQGISGCDVVFNLVGIIREFPKKKITFERAHPLFTKALTEGCREAGVRRYIHMSALAVDRGPAIGYNLSKMKSEQIVRESGLDWTIFRPSLIFGPGDRFAVEFAGWIKKGVPVPIIGEGDYQYMPVGRTDLCRGMAKLIDNPSSFGKIYDIGGPEKLSYAEILRILEKAAGKKALFIKTPIAVISTIAKIMGRFRWFPATDSMIKQMLFGSVTDSVDFWKETGIVPQKLGEGIGEYV